jgi:malonyl-CoA O-methyltransferase
MIFSPETYQTSDFLFRQTGDELLSRLDCFALKPQRVLVIGAGLGAMSAALCERYPASQVYSVDLSLTMLAASTVSNRIQADAAALPLQTASVDMIVAHALLPWVKTWAPVIDECRRVLRPGGLLMLSAFGPDTLKNCAVKTEVIYPVRIDMHDLGDMLIKAGFLEPVVDADHFTIRYQALSRLETELSGMGLPHFTLTSDAPPYAVNFECIWAHTFAPALDAGVSCGSDGVARFPLHFLRRSTA